MLVDKKITKLRIKKIVRIFAQVSTKSFDVHAFAGYEQRFNRQKVAHLIVGGSKAPALTRCLFKELMLNLWSLSKADVLPGSSFAQNNRYTADWAKSIWRKMR